MKITRSLLTKQTGSFRGYYVCFQDSEELTKFWRRFTRKGFEHCHVYMAYEGGTMCVTQTVRNVEVYTWPCAVEDMAAWLSRNGCTVVYLPVILRHRYKFRLAMAIPTCIGLCMRITGLTFNAFTPYHYFRKLLKNGGHLLGESDGRKTETG